MSEPQTEPTDQTAPEPVVVFTYIGPRTRAGKATEFLPGIPARDLTERDVARLRDGQRELLEGSGLYRATGEERKDPLGELSNDEFEALTPAEKGARTRKANELKRESEQQDEADQGNGAGEEAGDGESAGEESGA